jgi:hypothetical protein
MIVTSRVDGGHRFVRLRFPVVLIAILTTASTSLALTRPLLAATPVVPLPGEVFLTPAEKHEAVATMTASERAVLGRFFAVGAPGLLVAYSRAEYEVTESDDGSVTVEPVGYAVTNPVGNLSLPSRLQAAAEDSAVGGRQGTALFISLVVSKTRSTAPYEWELYSFAQWGSDGSYSPAGMNCCNDHRDYIGLAWAGGMAIHSDWKNGRYQAWCVGEPALNIATARVRPNTGIGMGFNEWWDRDNCPMYYGHTGVRIRATTWKNQLVNATSEYIHTWGGHSYALGFSATGPNVSISPTNETWSAPLYVAFKR